MRQGDGKVHVFVIGADLARGQRVLVGFSHRNERSSKSRWVRIHEADQRADRRADILFEVTVRRPSVALLQLVGPGPWPAGLFGGGG